MSFDTDQASSIPNLVVQSSNLLANLNASEYPSEIQMIVECIKYSSLLRAFTLHEKVPQSLVNLAFSTAIYQKDLERVQFEVQGGKKKTITKRNFCRLFGFQVDGKFITPTVEELIAMFNQMGYTPFITKISQFKKNRLPLEWNFFFTLFKRCLSGRKGGQDSASQQFLTALYGVYFDVKVDYGSIFWYEFVESLKISTRESELSSHRFWSAIVHFVYLHGDIPIDDTVSPILPIQTFQIPAKFADQSDFSFVGQIPDSMLKRIPITNELLISYRQRLIIPYPERIIPAEIRKEILAQAAKQLSKKRKEIPRESPKEQGSPKKVKFTESITEKGGGSTVPKPIKKSRTVRHKVRDQSDDDVETPSPTNIISSVVKEVNVLTSVDEEIVDVNVERLEENVVDIEKEMEKVDAQDNVDEDIVLVHVNEEDMPELDANVELRVDDVITKTNPIPDESVTEEDSSFNLIQRTVAQPRVLQLSAQSPEKLVASTEEERASQHQIFGNLQSLNVQIPDMTPKVPLPSVSEKAQTSQAVSPQASPVRTRVNEMEDDSDSDIQLAPLTFTDFEEEMDENELMSIKQYRTLNKKLNVLLQSFDDTMEKLGKKEAILGSQAEEVQVRMNEMSRQIDAIRKEMRQANAQQAEVNANVAKQLAIVVEKVGVLETSTVETLRTQLEASMSREAELKKELVESKLQTKQLYDRIPLFNPQEWSVAYNEGVVKHVGAVQSSLLNHLNPIIHFISRLPGFARHQAPTQHGGERTQSSGPASTVTLTPMVPFSKSIQISESMPSTTSVGLKPIAQKGIVLGHSSTQAVSSTGVFSEVGPSSTFLSKGKGKMDEMSEEEKKKMKDAEVESIRHKMSLINQGALSVEGAAFVTAGKQWTEDLIRNLGFGEDGAFQRMPKCCFDSRPARGFQLDLPMNARMFTVKCFSVSRSTDCSEERYNETLIKFYSRIGQKEDKVWSLREIKAIGLIIKTDVFDKLFQNYSLQLKRSDGDDYSITLADLPILNPADLIVLLAKLTQHEKPPVKDLVLHVRKMTQFYYNSMAENDLALAKAVGSTVPKPYVLRTGIANYPDGKIIHEPSWGIVFKSKKHGKVLSGLLEMDERERFSSDIIISVMKRLALCESNTKVEIDEVERLLNWTLAVRNLLLDARPFIFNRN